jgi:hypothetical protein
MPLNINANEFQDNSNKSPDDDWSLQDCKIPTPVVSGFVISMGIALYQWAFLFM